MEKTTKKTSQPHWRRHRSLNLSIGLVLSLTLVITAFEWNFKSDVIPFEIPGPTKVDVNPIEMVVVPHPPQPKPKIESLTEIEEIDEPVVEDPEKLIDKLPPIDEPAVNGEPDLGDLFQGDALGKEKPDRPTYDMIPAVPIGGHEAFQKYLYSKIHYPSHLVNLGKGGTVEVKFVVNENGEIDNIQILKGFDKTLEKEIIRVLKDSPAWKPARIGAKKVKMPFVIPFSFNLQ